jgi:hypothetical protein
MKTKILGLLPVLIGLFLIVYFCSNRSANTTQSDSYVDAGVADTSGTINGEFDIPELTVQVSPETEQSLTFPNTEKITDYDVSPLGLKVAALVENASKKSWIKFWKIGNVSVTDSCELPSTLAAKAIAWHPTGKSIFVMGDNSGKFVIYRVEEQNGKWSPKTIFSTPNPLRRLVVCPRPFITNNDYKSGKVYYNYRLFFGMDNGDKTYRIVSVTENGNKFYQVIGPKKTLEKENEEGVKPSEMEADWALPIAFHPSGYQLIWEDKSDQYKVATYQSKYWGESKPMDIPLKKNGTITPTPNGLGLVHWQKEKPGVGIYLLSTKKEEFQISNLTFISTPSSVPDGKGIVGLTNENGRQTLRYVPIKVPLADVMNAWMFNNSVEETDLFQKYYGLFRPNQDDQLYKLYETENYACGGYDRNSPTRPYFVTTDIFWELFGAAYQGLFIVKERDEAIPEFWKFVTAADSHLKGSSPKSLWIPVFSALLELKKGSTQNIEVVRINKGQDCLTELTNKQYAYSDLKPRGHYTSSKEMEVYFKAFRYFTTIYKTNQEVVKELNLLPEEIKASAEKWIKSYSGFISPSRSPLGWGNSPTALPKYCQNPVKDLSVFPLSWGFDNEVLYSTVYHQDLPAEIRVTGPTGERWLPSGLDLATSMGNGFAEKLLESDFQKYPPLRKVIGNLKKNYKENAVQPDLKDNLYNQWINAIAVQWADTVNSTNGLKDREIWQAKRLQTGLATWATLRHATILVNERTAAECGEGGFEEILLRAPRGYVEPDPFTFAEIANLFDTAVGYVSKTIANKADMDESDNPGKKSLYEGIVTRLKDAAREAKKFQAMAEKERKGQALGNEENEDILYVARTAEHLFLIFNSLSNKDYALSNPDPIAKIADVAGNSELSYLMAAVGDPMEWDLVVPFYGRHQIVKGSVYSYYEFKSNQLLTDKEWAGKTVDQELLPWINPFITRQYAEGMPATSY